MLENGPDKTTFFFPSDKNPNDVHSILMFISKWKHHQLAIIIRSNNELNRKNTFYTSFFTVTFLVPGRIF